MNATAKYWAKLKKRLERKVGKLQGGRIYYISTAEADAIYHCWVVDMARAANKMRQDYWTEDHDRTMTLGIGKGMTARFKIDDLKVIARIRGE